MDYIKKYEKLKKKVDNLLEDIQGFNDWDWCNCSECSKTSHCQGLNTHNTLLNIENFLKEYLK